MNLNSSGKHQFPKSNHQHTELTNGTGHVKKLQIDLNMPASSDETHELFTHKVLNSDDEALSQYSGTGIRSSQSPNPSSGRPHDENSDRSFNDPASRKKKSNNSSISKWKQQVKVSPEIGLEVPPNDGYMWRKYGQKEILNAKYPREYYRCTYRTTHGCIATKQVQRCTDDPSIFEITYLGKHTCPKIIKTSDSSAAPESAYGVINFSSTTRTSRTSDSFQLSNWPQHHN